MTIQDIDSDQTVQVLLDAVIAAIGEDRPPTLDEVLRAACYATRLTRAELVGPRRTRSVAHMRQAAMWIAARATRRSLTQIGQAFGDRDHTTVLHAMRAVAARIGARDPDTVATVDGILRVLRGRRDRAVPVVSYLPPRTPAKRAERPPPVPPAQSGDLGAPAGSRPWFMANEARFQAAFITAHPERALSVTGVGI